MHKHVFDGPIKGYLVNEMTRNLWRVSATMTEEDFLQEGYLVYMKCAKYYPDAEPKHFMSLYKTALERRIVDLANLDTRNRTASTTDETGTERDVAGDLENDGYLRVLVKQAPAEVVQVLTLFLNAPSELLQMAMTSWRRDGHLEAGGNRQVAQWLGMPPTAKPLDAVRDYFETI